MQPGEFGRLGHRDQAAGLPQLRRRVLGQPLLARPEPLAPMTERAQSLSSLGAGHAAGQVSAWGR